MRMPDSDATPPPSRLSKKDYELLARFRYTLRTFLGFSEDAALRHGVTPQQYQALLAIEGFPGRNWVGVGELAEQMRVAHHSAVGLVDRLEKLNLVRRAAAPENQRRVRLLLVPKRPRRAGKLYRIHHAELQSVGPSLIELLRQAGAPEVAPI